MRRAKTDHDSVSSPSAGLSRRQRLRSSRLIRETYAQGTRWVGRCMVLWLRRGDDASLRVAVVASRKVGGAVARARAKRLLREVYRRERANLDGAYDVVLVARRAILTAEWPQLIKEMRYLAKKAGLVPGRNHQKAREIRAEGRQEAVNGEGS